MMQSFTNIYQKAIVSQVPHSHKFIVQQGRQTLDKIHTEMVIWVQLWRAVQGRRMICHSEDAHLVWRSGKASLRRAIFKTLKPTTDLVKRKGKWREGRRAFQRERDQCVQRPRARRDERDEGTQGRPMRRGCEQLQGWEWGGTLGLGENEGSRDLDLVLKSTI